jgi:hypothetical protein
MPSTGLSSGIKINFGNWHRNAKQSVIIMLNKSAAQLRKERKEHYDQLAGR